MGTLNDWFQVLYQGTFFCILVFLFGGIGAKADKTRNSTRTVILKSIFCLLGGIVFGLLGSFGLRVFRGGLMWAFLPCIVGIAYSAAMLRREAAKT